MGTHLALPRSTRSYPDCVDEGRFEQVEHTIVAATVPSSRYKLGVGTTASSLPSAATNTWAYLAFEHGRHLNHVDGIRRVEDRGERWVITAQPPSVDGAEHQ